MVRSAGDCQELRRLAVTLAKELGTTIVKLIPSIHGVCITFADEVLLPGIVVCAEGKLNSNTLLELVASNCRQIELLTHKMLGKDQDGRIDQSGEDRPPLGRAGQEAPLPDGSSQSPDPEVLSENSAASGDAGKQD